MVVVGEPVDRDKARVADAIRVGSEVFHALRKRLAAATVADLEQTYELSYPAHSQRYLLRNLNTGEQQDFGSLQAATAAHPKTHYAPGLARRMRMLRNWGGIVDVTPDRSPILSKTPIAGLYVNCGWGTGGFKATPGSGWVYAETIATGEATPTRSQWPG